MGNKRVVLLRCSGNEKSKYGILSVIENERILFICRSIENLSKIFPDGIYPIRLEHSPHFDRLLWELYNVTGYPGEPDRKRAEIKIHNVAYYYQLDGCIGVGASHVDLDGDGINDITSSKDYLNKFMEAMSGVTVSTIEVITVH